MPASRDSTKILAAAGVVPGTDLATAIEACGWRWSVESHAGSNPGRPRYQALVTAPRDPRDQRDPGDQHARGRGATEEAALAQALVRMLMSVQRAETRGR